MTLLKLYRASAVSGCLSHILQDHLQLRTPDLCTATDTLTTTFEAETALVVSDSKNPVLARDCAVFVQTLYSLVLAVSGSVERAAVLVLKLALGK